MPEGNRGRLKFPASVRGCLTVLALLAGLLILGGLSGWVASGSAATVYQRSPHERLPATVLTAGRSFVENPGDRRSHGVCLVQLEGTFGTPTVQIDEISGACDRTSPLKAGAVVEAEFWRGKVTKVFAGAQGFSTTNDPVDNASLSVLALGAGIVIGALVLVGFALRLAVIRLRSPAVAIVGEPEQKQPLRSRIQAAAASARDLAMTTAVLSIVGLVVGLLSVAVLFPHPQGWTFIENAGFLVAAGVELVAFIGLTERLIKRFANRLLGPGGRTFTLAWEALAIVAQAATWLLLGWLFR